jgi:dienelactone hydrolase
MFRFLCSGACLALLPAAAWCAPQDAGAVAAKFGARSYVIDASLSPDGKRVVFVVPTSGKGTAVLVADADGGNSKIVAFADGKPLNLIGCGWSAADRLVCQEYGISTIAGTPAPFTRTVALDAAGGNFRWLGRQSNNNNALRVSQFDGAILDWLSGSDGNILMQRDYVPEQTIGTHLAEQRDGQGVDRVDTRSGRSQTVESPQQWASSYISDGQGRIRISILAEQHGDVGMLTGGTVYQYRTTGSHGWRPFGRHVDGDGAFRPIAVDGTKDVAYALKKLDGRDALYRVSLDGSLKSELVYANPQVDVDDVVTIGRSGRVIGAGYVTDRRDVEYFDPEYKALAAALAKALPTLPLIDFLSASADEKQLLIRASSDSDPGHYYWFDRTTHHLNELTPARPELEQTTLSQVRSVTYHTADGVDVPAYLTLPPGSDGKHLPAILMPHGGPASRDEWGFDWLAQYFAQRGFAVLQPEFRGSRGYGDAWFVDNGFKSWRTAIGDIDEGARWLVKQGIADPDKLAIVGWSYGGYAALQANVVDPSLYKAVVAIAPVTDLAALKQESLNYTNHIVQERYIGTGPHITEGSPALHADKFVAPVLMFHGDQDINVGVGESHEMDAALRRAGKSSQLVVYPGLDHQLDDNVVRTDMLTKADAFLRTTLKIATP